MSSVEKRKQVSSCAATAAGNGCNPRPRSHVGGGGFSHVAVRSCASRASETFVREPRLLRPSITLRAIERETRKGREDCGGGSTVKKRKLTLKFQGDAFLVTFPTDFTFRDQQKESIYHYFRYSSLEIFLCQ